MFSAPLFQLVIDVNQKTLLCLSKDVLACHGQYRGSSMINQ